MENGIWSEWSPWSPCAGDCNHSLQYRWRDCDQSKQLGGYIRCVGQPFETQNCIKPQCKLPVSPSIYPGGRKSGGDKLHNQMDVELSEKNDNPKGGPNSNSEENNPDFHVRCNIQCRPGGDCQKLRAQCLRAGQGSTKVKVSTNEIKIKTGPGETGLEGSSMKDSKKGAQLKEPEVLFYSTGFRIALIRRKLAKRAKQRASRQTKRGEKRSVDFSEPLPANITFISNGIGNELEVAQPDADNSVSPASKEKLLLKQSKEVKAGQLDDVDDDDNDDDDDPEENHSNYDHYFEDDDDFDEDNDSDNNIGRDQQENNSDEDDNDDTDNKASTDDDYDEKDDKDDADEANAKRNKQSFEDEIYDNDSGLDPTSSKLLENTTSKYCKFTSCLNYV